MVMLPVPGARRTRATDSLRRPTEMWSWGISIPLQRELERLGLLRDVRVLPAGIDLELAHHVAAERAARQHAAHGVEQDGVGVARAELVGRRELRAARVHRVREVELVRL